MRRRARERERGTPRDPIRDRMEGHDVLPPEWRELSRRCQDRFVEYRYKRGDDIARVERLLRWKETYKANQARKEREK